MLAPLRKPWVRLLVALFTAPMVFRCLGSVNAHPLENDLSVSARTTLDSGSLLDVRVDSPPPPYTSDPEDESEDDEVLSEDDDSLPEDDETLPGADDDEAPPQYSFQIHSIDYVDELGGKARLNGFKSVLLEADPLELGRNDPEGLSRKYYIIDPDDPERRVVLKIIDLLKAKKLGDRFPTLLMREGWYWNQMKGNRFLWETKEPVEQQNHRGQVIKSDYMVVYRPARTGLFLGEKYADGDPRITELMSRITSILLPPSRSPTSPRVRHTLPLSRVCRSGPGQSATPWE